MISNILAENCIASKYPSPKKIIYFFQRENHNWDQDWPAGYFPAWSIGLLLLFSGILCSCRCWNHDGQLKSRLCTMVPLNKSSRFNMCEIWLVAQLVKTMNKSRSNVFFFPKVGTCGGSTNCTSCPKNSAAAVPGAGRCDACAAGYQTEARLDCFFRKLYI